LGRWESSEEWRVRTKFTEVEDAREQSEAQAGTVNRYEMAQRLGMVERVALQLNVADLPFRDERLASSLGLKVDDFDDMPVSPAAVNVVYDALAHSRTGLLPPDVCDARRASFFQQDGSFNELAFRLGLYRARFTVIVSWFLFGKGNILGALILAKVATDLAGGDEIFDRLLANQELVLVGVGTAALMTSVGQAQEEAAYGPPKKKKEEGGA